MNRAEFYQMIGTGIRRYLPMGYQEYQLHMKEAEISGEKNALLVMEKEGIKKYASHESGNLSGQSEGR